MIVPKHARHVVLLLLVTFFLYMMVISISKWRQGKVGEAWTSKKASEMFYPSVTMLPIFDLKKSLAKLNSFKNSKNLTEYYSKTPHIKRDIISIQQTYETSNG